MWLLLEVVAVLEVLEVLEVNLKIESHWLSGTCNSSNVVNLFSGDL